MSDVRPFSPSQAAELADPERKRESTALATACLLGIPIRKIAMPDGRPVYATSLRKFAGLCELEDYLDRFTDGG